MKLRNFCEYGSQKLNTFTKVVLRLWDTHNEYHDTFNNSKKVIVTDP